MIDQNSNSSEKKTSSKETNLSTITENIVFKGGSKNDQKNSSSKSTSKNKNKGNKDPQLPSSPIIKSTSHDNNLSFRTKDGRQTSEVDEIEKLCLKVTEALSTHEPYIHHKQDKEVDFKKIFVKKNEKELEVFESERPMKNDIIDDDSSSDNDDDSEYDDNDNPTSGHHKSKSLSKVICTLSKIENGFATFVSKDDLIFVLPSFFIPKDLHVGNTYLFKLGEIEQASNKMNKVDSIHKFYAQDQNE